MKDLYKLACAFEKASQQAPAGGYYNPAKPSDPKIMSLQNCLMNLGFPLKHGADGILGEETMKAINAFKSKYKLMNASPDIVYARIHAEADKLLGGKSDNVNQLAFKTPAPGSEEKHTGTNIGVNDLLDSQYAVPDSGNFTPLK